jgi:hypothetical protein
MKQCQANINDKVCKRRPSKGDDYCSIHMKLNVHSVSEQLKRQQLYFKLISVDLRQYLCLYLDIDTIDNICDKFKDFSCLLQRTEFCKKLYIERFLLNNEELPNNIAKKYWKNKCRLDAVKTDEEKFNIAIKYNLVKIARDTMDKADVKLDTFVWLVKKNKLEILKLFRQRFDDDNFYILLVHALKYKQKRIAGYLYFEWSFTYDNYTSFETTLQIMLPKKLYVLLQKYIV